MISLNNWILGNYISQQFSPDPIRLTTRAWPWRRPPSLLSPSWSRWRWIAKSPHQSKIVLHACASAAHHSHAPPSAGYGREAEWDERGSSNSDSWGWFPSHQGRRTWVDHQGAGLSSVLTSNAFPFSFYWEFPALWAVTRFQPVLNLSHWKQQKRILARINWWFRFQSVGFFTDSLCLWVWFR